MSNEEKKLEVKLPEKLWACGTPMLSQYYNSLDEAGKAQFDRKFKESLEKIRAARMQKNAPDDTNRAS